MLEWSRATDGWSATPLERIDDPCFVQPLPIASLLQATHADEAVLRALRTKGHPEFDAVRGEGREQGRWEGRDEGRAEQARVGIVDLCESMGLELDAARRSGLARMGLAELAELRQAFERERRWPTA